MTTTTPSKTNATSAAAAGPAAQAGPEASRGTDGQTGADGAHVTREAASASNPQGPASATTSSSAAALGSSTTAKHTKVVKRYANRKLYDTDRSCYVTLEEIAQMIKDGDDIKIVDNKTKDDLTAVTLAQIIVEEEKKVQKMPLKLLRSIIQSGSELPDWKGAIGDFYADRVIDPVKRIREDVASRVDSLLKRDARDGASAQPPESASSEAAPGTSDAGQREDVKAGVVKEFVHHTAEAFEAWQKRIDERVREAVGKMAKSPRPDVEALRARIDALEAKIRHLEARRHE